LGFLLNNSESILKNAFPPEVFLLRQLPMLFVEAIDENGGYSKDYAFNDAWVERATPQSAWLELSINGKTRIPKMVCDGALLATPSGSTAYARSMGAAPLLADTLGWLIAGSNVMTPGGWKSALLSPDSVIELRNLDKNKRPIQGFVDGRPLNKLELFRVRLSRTATVELAFLPSHDISEKIADVQFPSISSAI
jgi:NAD kinase